MNKEIQIESVMTRAPYTIGEDQLLEVAKHELAHHGIRHLPVLRGGHCVGIISDRDIKLAYAVEPERARAMKVSDAYTDSVYSVSPHETVGTVAKILAERGIGCAVVEEKGRVIGIFTVVDACRVLASVLAA